MFCVCEWRKGDGGFGRGDMIGLGSWKKEEKKKKKSKTNLIPPEKHVLWAPGSTIVLGRMRFEMHLRAPVYESA